jgi:hypothetical protein
MDAFCNISSSSAADRGYRFRKTSRPPRRPQAGQGDIAPPRLLVGAILMLSWLAGGSALALEEPEYRVVERQADFELRRYAPYLVAETRVSGDFEDAGGAAFRILADYIFGNNSARKKIEMTAPVSQRPGEGQRIGRQSPVQQRAAPAAGEVGNYYVSFVMPSRFTRDTLPVPNDDRVRIREVPGGLVAARRYSGFWTEERYREQHDVLQAALDRAGLEETAPPVYARYNSPFSLWFLRRNEVLIAVHAPAAGGG